MRIITGKAKGLNLKTPKGLMTRPTSDRIKESLFNILNGMFDFTGKMILDLFAGTGALGLEAMSRGSKQAVFIDMRTTGIIKDNVKRGHFIDDSEILCSDVFKGITRLSVQQRQFDLIFCDPPYNKGLCEQTLTAVDGLNLLSAEGLFIAEHGIDELMDASLVNIAFVRQIKYGHTTAIDIFKNNYIN